MVLSKLVCCYSTMLLGLLVPSRYSSLDVYRRIYVVYVYVCVYMHTWMCIRAHTHMRGCMHACMHTFLLIYFLPLTSCMHVHIHMHVHTNRDSIVVPYILACSLTDAHACTHTNARTHTHTDATRSWLLTYTCTCMCVCVCVCMHEYT